MATRNDLVKKNTYIEVEIPDRLNAYVCLMKSEAHITDRIKSSYEIARKMIQDQIAQGKKTASICIQNSIEVVAQSLWHIFEEDEFIVKRVRFENNTVYIDIEWDNLPLKAYYPGGKIFNESKNNIENLCKL